VSEPIRFAGSELVLTAPPRVSHAYALLLAVEDIAGDTRKVRPTHFVLAAALGLCVARVRSRIPFDGDVLAFGMKVVDLFLGPDVKLGPGDEAPTMLELVQHGQRALEVIRASIPTAQMVERTAVFSEPPSGDSSASGSRLNDGGDAPPDGSPS